MPAYLTVVPNAACEQCGSPHVCVLEENTTKVFWCILMWRAFLKTNIDLKTKAMHRDRKSAEWWVTCVAHKGHIMDNNGHLIKAFSKPYILSTDSSWSWFTDSSWSWYSAVKRFCRKKLSSQTLHAHKKPDWEIFTLPGAEMHYSEGGWSYFYAWLY